MINKIQELAANIENSYNSDEQVFSEFSLNLLSSFENDLSQSEFENALGEWTLNNNLDEQLNVYNGFGQPPFTLFNNGKFVIDLYFWLDIDTSIHSHSFSGAFKVLYGRSIHETYSIKPKKILTPDIMQTEINLKSSSLIKAGDCFEITQGNRFSHRLIHLDKPTITLCIRTIDDDQNSQWHHFTNGLSVEKKELTQFALKRLFYCNYLFMRDFQNGFNYLERLILTWDCSTMLNLYERLSLDSMGLEGDVIESFFEIFIKEYGESIWFKSYLEFFENLQENFIEVEGDSAESRFMEHALNFNYTNAGAVSLLEEIQGCPVKAEQTAQLATLK